MYELAGYTLLAIGAAVAVILVAFRNRPAVREHLGPLAPATSSPPLEVAVEATEPDGEVPQSPSGSGAPLQHDEFDLHADQALAIANDTPEPEVFVHAVTDPPVHVHAFCSPCRAVMCFRHAGEVIAHLLSHNTSPAEVADFAAWETELQASS